MFIRCISLLLIIYHYLTGGIKCYKHNKISFGKNLIIRNSKIKIFGRSNKVTFGNFVSINKTIITIRGNNNCVFLENDVKIYEYCNILIEGDNCNIKIGTKTTIGSSKIFCGEGNTKIVIGKNCMLSREVFMNTSDFHSILDVKTNQRINQPRNIFIEDHVWIGFNTTINKGAILEKDSIVASRSVVGGKLYPPNVLLAGIPAKIIKDNVTWSREKLPYN
jgi:acetyltransferase-like isoleucine patch superfamily enzyme